MNLRKEQILLIATLAVAALVYSSLGTPPQRFTYKPDLKHYEPGALPPSPLAKALEVAIPKRDWCREPSETQPLPPRPLAFPPRPPLSLVGLLLEPGPDLAVAQTVRLDGSVVEGVATLAGGGGDANAVPSPTAPVDDGQGAATATMDEKRARYAKIYDRVWNTANPTIPLFGIVEYPDGNRFALEAANTDFSDKKIWLRQFSPAQEKMIPGRQLLDGKQIKSIHLADNLRNDVQRRLFTVPKDLGNLDARRSLIDWLLEKGREDASVYDEAQKQAELFFQQSKTLEGLQMMARVLRARGDLQGEYQLYQQLPPQFVESAFRYQGLGVLEARLGLDADAERDLKQAVEKAPQDPRTRAALAGFLRRHGKAAAANVEADQALATIGMLSADAEVHAVVRELVACRLAVADVEGARAVLRRDPDAPPYLTGCIEYAAGRPDTALESFQLAAGGPDSMAALLGVGACQTRLAHAAADPQWQDARVAFETVAEQAPLLRHRALCGLALLCLRAGQNDLASSYLDRALEASPQDVYALYLRGRLLRNNSDLAAAMEVSSQVLRQHDDFVFAVAERAMLHAQLADSGSELEQAENRLAARNYGDRAVVLASPHPVQELVELQARLRFLAADLRGAEAAFAAARDMAADDGGKLYGRAGQILCDYRRNHVDDARRGLLDLCEYLAKGEAMRVWAEDTLRDIDDHSQKEQLDDHFDRPGPDLGNVWIVQREGAFQPEIKGDQLRIKGTLPRSAEISAERREAVKKAGGFLAVEVVMTVGAGNARDSTVGLRIDAGNRGGAQQGLTAWIGLRDGSPFLNVADGREEPIKLALPAVAYELGKPQRLRFEVAPRDAQQKQQVLLCFWNGVPVHDPIKLTTLHTGSSGDLHTVLFATSSRKDANLDVGFDDYHLERRKDG